MKFIRNGACNYTTRYPVGTYRHTDSTVFITMRVSYTMHVSYIMLVAAAAILESTNAMQLVQSTTTVLRTARKPFPALHMKARYEDAEDRRLSQGGSGGRYGQIGGFGSLNNKAEKRSYLAKRGFNAPLDSQMIRAQKLDAYLNNDLEATDGTFGKIMAGTFLLTLFGLLFAVFIYYGTDGLAAATAGQRAVRGI